LIFSCFKIGAKTKNKLFGLYKKICAGRAQAASALIKGSEFHATFFAKFEV
jgi:hypothetical protein